MEISGLAMRELLYRAEVLNAVTHSTLLLFARHLRILSYVQSF